MEEREALGTNYEDVLSSLYGGEQVMAVINIKVNTKEADKLASDISEYDCIEDVFLVTGDTDIVAKARFRHYKELKDFVVDELGKLSGLKETKTLMVVSTYKERGIKK
ncbi:MAG: Lrp/AsnC ligand binding domain-containing protein [Candidatus Thermoplasmatota archaeon]